MIEQKASYDPRATKGQIGQSAREAKDIVEIGSSKSQEIRNDVSEKKFRGLQVEIDPRGTYSIRGTEGVSAFEIYGILTVLLKKMEKDLGVQS